MFLGITAMKKPRPQITPDERIRRLYVKINLMLPYQRRRFNRWVKHYRLTGQFLVDNFKRLETTIRWISKRNRSVEKSQSPDYINPQFLNKTKTTPTVVYKKTRRINRT